MHPERIDKIIASGTQYSRKDVKKLIKKRAVLADGSVVLSADEKYDPENTEISVNGTILSYKKFIYLMLHKPQGVVSATEDARERTVLDLLREEEYRCRKLFPAGRLDKDTTGFVLLTDDGEFAHGILAPTRHVTKTYILTAVRAVSVQEAEKMTAGMTIGGEPLMPAHIRLLQDGVHPTYEIKIRQGKYHQIKRMFSEFDNRVLTLHRTAIGGLSLDASLAAGAYRELTAEELLQIQCDDKADFPYNE